MSPDKDYWEAYTVISTIRTEIFRHGHLWDSLFKHDLIWLELHTDRSLIDYLE